MTRAEKAAFSGGVLCALTVIGMAGEDTYYDEIVASCHAASLLYYARKNHDVELPRLRKSVRRIKERRQSLGASA